MRISLKCRHRVFLPSFITQKKKKKICYKILVNNNIFILFKYFYNYIKLVILYIC